MIAVLINIDPCRQCGGPVPVSTGPGPQRAYCTDRCRGRAFRQQNKVSLQTYNRDYHQLVKTGASRPRKTRSIQEKQQTQRLYRASRLEETRSAVDALKDVPCADCGQKWPPVAMDFDHVRGVKLHNIATMVVQSRPLETILREAAKCDVVCACCHRIRTFSRLSEEVTRVQ